MVGVRGRWLLNRCTPAARSVFSAAVTSSVVATLLVMAYTAPASSLAAGRRVVQFVRLAGSVSPVPPGAFALGEPPASQSVGVDVVLRVPHPQALSHFVSEVSTPGSPEYGKYLKRGAFADKFGPSASSIARVRTSLARLGLHPGPVSSNGLIIPVHTTAVVAEKAFHVHLERYRLATSRIVFANTDAPSVPSTIASDVEGLIGLDTVPQLHPLLAGAASNGGATAGTAGTGATVPAIARRSSSSAAAQAVRSPKAPSRITVPVQRAGRVADRAAGPVPCSSATSTASANSAYTANQLASAYGLTAAYGAGSLGKGETVALFELTTFSSSNVTNYEACYGVSTAVTTETVDPGATGTGSGPVEAALDIEDVIGLAPQSKIIVYESPNTNKGSVDEYNRMATDDSAQVISSSWGSCDVQTGQAVVATQHVIFEQMAAQGQTMLNAAGDTGSAGCGTVPLTSVSCASASFCMAVDASGAALSWNGSSWSQTSVIDNSPNGPQQLSSVSCVSSSFCIAVDTSGNALNYPGGNLWSAPQLIDASAPLASVSCATTTFCVAVDTSGNALIFSVKAGATSPSWSSPQPIDPNGGGLVSVSCPTAGFCMTADMKGNSLYYSGGTWSPPSQIDSGGNPFAAVSCPSSSYCVLVNSDFIVYTYSSGSLFSTPLTVDSAPPTSVSCSPSVTFCAMVDAAGDVYDFNGSAWSGPSGIAGETLALTSVSCVTATPFCAAVDVGGNALTQAGTNPIVGPTLVDDPLSAGYPASDPYVTGVGGTSLSAVGPPPSETVWNDGPGSAGSGGISSLFGMPSWQSGSGVPGVINSYSSNAPCAAAAPAAKYCREEPDVSASGDPNHGYVIYYGSSWTVVGGTSAATPTWAALLALMNEVCGVRIGFANPMLYQAAKADPGAFNDITTGNNDSYGNHGGSYPATPGYDMASGIGSPNGAALEKYVCTHRPVGPPPPPKGAASGYRFVASDGGIFSFNAPFYGSMGGKRLNAPIVGMAADPATGGYWFVASDGGIFSFNAPFYGSMGGKRLNAPIVGMAADPATGGYWFVASDGGIFSFNAPFYGSMGGKRLNAPIVGMASTPNGGGYWFVASDGGIFSFGNAKFYGSMGGKPLNKPIVGMAADPATGGYWFVASDGGIFSFNAPFLGSMGGKNLNAPIVGMAADPATGGYWFVASDGGIFSFNAPFYGSMGGKRLNAPIAGLATS